MPPRQAGPIIERRLRAAIHAIEGIHTIRGHPPVTAEQVRLALLITLRLDLRKWRWTASERRIEAMMLLGIPSKTAETWRRKFGPERELLAILAEALVMPVTVQTSN
jgi:hypothetical protein